MARILVIDTNDRSRTELRQLLERANYDVCEAESSQEGLSQFQSDPADIVLTEIISSQGEGIHAIQELLLQYPSARIVAMLGSSKNSPAWLPLAKRLGSVTVLNKPFSNEQLLNCVYHALTY